MTDDGLTRTSYAEVAERIDRLCNALREMGVGPGDRVATFGWNTQRHLELYLAVPCMGAVLHTLNIRLFPEQLTYIVNHAKDKLLFVDESLLDVLEPVAPTFDVRRAHDRARRRVRAAARRPARRLRLPGARRPPGRGPLLHERHDRQPEGRPVLAPLERPARDGQVPGGRGGRAPRRPRAADRADVPRERLGLPVRLRDDGRRPGHALAVRHRASRWPG